MAIYKRFTYLLIYLLFLCYLQTSSATKEWHNMESKGLHIVSAGGTVADVVSRRM